jgi:hypothetical protein
MPVETRARARRARQTTLTQDGTEVSPPPNRAISSMPMPPVQRRPAVYKETSVPDVVYVQRHSSGTNKVQSAAPTDDTNTGCQVLTATRLAGSAPRDMLAKAALSVPVKATLPPGDVGMLPLYVDDIDDAPLRVVPSPDVSPGYKPWWTHTPAAKRARPVSHTPEQADAFRDDAARRDDARAAELERRMHARQAASPLPLRRIHHNTLQQRARLPASIRDHIEPIAMDDDALSTLLAALDRNSVFGAVAEPATVLLSLHGCIYPCTTVQYDAMAQISSVDRVAAIRPSVRSILLSAMLPVIPALTVHLITHIVAGPAVRTAYADAVPRPALLDFHDHVQMIRIDYTERCAGVAVALLRSLSHGERPSMVYVTSPWLSNTERADQTSVLALADDELTLYNRAETPAQRHTLLLAYIAARCVGVSPMDMRASLVAAHDTRITLDERLNVSHSHYHLWEWTRGIRAAADLSALACVLFASAPLH